MSVVYTRKLKKEIAAQLENDLAIVVTGMRRVGKTFLIQDILRDIPSPNKIYIDLEKPENKNIFDVENYDTIIRNFESLGISIGKEKDKRAWIFLDEIQQIKQMPSIIKYFHDHYNVKFIVTGSSSYYLKNLFTESLSGRKLIFHLKPLDFGEFLTFKEIDHNLKAESIEDLVKLNTKLNASKYLNLFEEYLKTGGFPQAVLEKDPIMRATILKEILDSYVNIDVKALSDFKGIEDMKKLIYLLPARIGQKVDVSKISRVVGLSRQTVNSYLRFLEDTFVISTIAPFSKSPDREISQATKMFFCDHAFANVLNPISEGQLFENYVFNALSKLYSLNYYQRKSGAEIDFILDKRIGIEAKVFGDKFDFKKLKSVAEDIGLEDEYVISKIPNKPESKEILPAFLLGFLD